MRKLIKIAKEGFGAAFTVFDYIEFFIIVCFGTALLAATIWGISKAILQKGSTLYLILFTLFVLISISSFIHDIINKRLGNISKFFLACWGVCVLFAGWIWFS